MPTSTDLVTDLPADFEVFGQAVDTSLADLKGGTTGQVLSKATGTDMDFTWVTTDDANAIQNSIVDAKGDLVAASANDTPARLAVGNNGETLVCDSSTSTGLRYQPTMAAGKNICINGGFDIWQRGTSFTTFVYTADRWKMNPGGTVTVSQDTDVPTGVGVRYSLKQLTSASSSYSQYQMGFEQATTIPMRNQVYTFSFYMKANATWSGAFSPQIYYSNSSDTLSTIMSGTLVTATGNTTPTPTTSWVRYSVTFTVPSDAVGIGVYFAPAAVQASGAALWIAGCQWEIGSVATAFTRSGGTIQGELAACQRYYFRSVSGNAYAFMPANGIGFNATTVDFVGRMPVTMRVAPTSVDFSTLRCYDDSNALPITNLIISSNQPDATYITATVASGGTLYRPYFLGANNSATAYLGYSAEL